MFTASRPSPPSLRTADAGVWSDEGIGPLICNEATCTFTTSHFTLFGVVELVRTQSLSFKAGVGGGVGVWIPSDSRPN